MNKQRNRHTGRVNAISRHILDTAAQELTYSDGTRYACGLNSYRVHTDPMTGEVINRVTVHTQVKIRR